MIWLNKLLNYNKEIVIGKDLTVKSLEERNELPPEGKIGVLYKIKYYDDPMIWDDVRNEYIILRNQSKLK